MPRPEESSSPPRRWLPTALVAGVVAAVILVQCDTFLRRWLVPAASAAARATHVPSMEDPAEAQLTARLDHIHFSAAPLDQALDSLRRQANVNVVVDWKSIATGGIPRNTPVELELKDVTLDAALHVLFDTVSTPTCKIGTAQRGNVIFVSTGEPLSAYTMTRVYDIADIILVEQDRDRRLYPPGTPHGGSRQTYNQTGATGDNDVPRTKEQIVEDVTRLVMETIAPDSWRDTGGMAGGCHEFSGRLIIVQTAESHRQIERLLAEIRRTGTMPIVQTQR